VLNDYTLAGDLDRQFGDLSVGLRKILLSMIHGFAGTLAGSFASTTGGPPRYEEKPLPLGRLLGRNWFKCYRCFVTDILVRQRPPKFCVKVGCYYFATQLAGDTARDSRPPNQGPSTTLAPVPGPIPEFRHVLTPGFGSP
jgi:hypothetical protein